MSEKIFFNAEKFNLKTEALEDGSEQIILEGIAMPLGKMSRNKVFYRPESVKKAYSTMKGCAFLFNHNTDISLGHVEDASIDGDNMMYRANVDPTETKYINKVKRQDIRNVSVGCLVDALEFMDDGSVTCDVVEFVELSLVPVPGFADASAKVKGEFLEVTPLMLAEKFGRTDIVEKLKAEACKKKEEPETEEPEEKPEEEQLTSGNETEELKKEEETPEPTIEEKVSALSSRVEEVFSKFEEMLNVVSALESKIEEIKKTQEADDSEKPTEDETEEPETETETEEPETEEKEEEEPEKPQELLTPDKTEKFSSDKITQKSKEEIEAKKKELLGNETNKSIVNMNEVRLRNLSY